MRAIEKRDGNGDEELALGGEEETGAKDSKDLDPDGDCDDGGGGEKGVVFGGKAGSCKGRSGKKNRLGVTFLEGTGTLIGGEGVKSVSPDNGFFDTEGNRATGCDGDAGEGRADDLNSSTAFNVSEVMAFSALGG